MPQLIIEPICVSKGRVRVKGRDVIELRGFQEELIRFFSSSKTYLFLSAPTGSGKTFTTLSPLLSNILYGTSYDGVLGIYPTKPLTIDQFESMKSVLNKFGAEKRVSESAFIYDVSLEVEEGSIKRAWSGRIGLVALTRNSVDKLKEVLGTAAGRSVLEYVRDALLMEDVKYLVTVSVPEYPYLMLSHIYRSRQDAAKILEFIASGRPVYRQVLKLLSVIDADEASKQVRRLCRLLHKIVGSRVAERELANVVASLLPPVLFFDEFHTWSFYELPTAVSLVLMHRLTSLLSNRSEAYKVVFSSATPNKIMIDVLGKIAGNDFAAIEVDPICCRDAHVDLVRGETCIELFPIDTYASDYKSWFEIDAALPKVVAEKADEIRDSGRAIVFGRRVYAVEEAAKKFYDKTGIRPSVVTGVEPPPGFPGGEEVRDKKESGKLYVFGNYAVELGVDLRDIRYSIISASNIGELVQRMGRSGRGISSKVVILIPRHCMNKLSSIQSKEIQYRQFIEALKQVMPDKQIVEEYGSRAIIYEGREKVREARLYLLGKLRIYLPLASFTICTVFRHKDKPRDLAPMLYEFKRIANAFAFNEEFFTWLSNKVSKNYAVLIELASFRLASSVPYCREGKPDAVGESNPITLLSNFNINVDVDGRIIVKSPHKRSIVDVTSLELVHPMSNVLKELDHVILSSRLAFDLIKVSGKVVDIFKQHNTPFYVVYVKDKEYQFVEHELLDLLHAFGYALRLASSGVTYAYFLIL